MIIKQTERAQKEFDRAAGLLSNRQISGGLTSARREWNGLCIRRKGVDEVRASASLAPFMHCVCDDLSGLPDTRGFAVAQQVQESAEDNEKDSRGQSHCVQPMSLLCPILTV